MIKTIKDIKKGEYFTLTNIAEPTDSQVYIRGEYDKATKTYSCCKFSDMNAERFFKGNKQVFVGFTF